MIHNPPDSPSSLSPEESELQSFHEWLKSVFHGDIDGLVGLKHSEFSYEDMLGCWLARSRLPSAVVTVDNTGRLKSVTGAATIVNDGTETIEPKNDPQPAGFRWVTLAEDGKSWAVGKEFAVALPVEAIKVALVYLDDALKDSEYKGSQDPVWHDMYATNSAAIRMHISALRALIPSAPGAAHE